MSQTAYRTHHATEVTEQLVGQKVTLAGWVDRRRDHGGVAFIDLRDNTGLVQVVIYDEEMARPLRSEFVIQVVGEVRLRPDGNENEHLPPARLKSWPKASKCWPSPMLCRSRSPPLLRTSPRTSCRARTCV